MSLRCDSILLCGYILGRGGDIPASIQSVIDRFISSDGSEPVPDIDVTSKAEVFKKPEKLIISEEPVHKLNTFDTPMPIPEKVTEREEIGETTPEKPEKLPSGKKMGRKSKLSDVIEAIALRYVGGETVKDLAKEFEVKENTLYYQFKKLGVKKPAVIDADPAADEGAPDPAPIEEEKPADNFIIKGVDKLQDDYIGDRKGTPSSLGDLQPSDWPDIKRMKDNGLPVKRIASSYDVEEDYLLRFMAMEADKEAKARGNR